MRKVNIGVIFFLFIVFLYPESAWADGATAPAIFGELAKKASAIGSGLRNAGYVIAGLGLIFFSFMAIFNKISWKTLAYIMMSCFFLTFMWGIISFVSQGGNTGGVKMDFTNGDASVSGGVPAAPTGK